MENSGLNLALKCSSIISNYEIHSFFQKTFLNKFESWDLFYSRFKKNQFTCGHEVTRTNDIFFSRLIDNVLLSPFS